MTSGKTTDKTAMAVMLVGIGFAFYWMFTYSGPYRYLAELQLKWFGWYVPKLTILIIVLGFIGIAAGIKVLLRGAEVPAPTMPQATAAPAKLGLALSTAAHKNPNAWIMSPYARLWVVAIPIAMGGYFYFTASQAGPLQQLQVADFDSGAVKSRVVYAEVRGYLTHEYMMKDTYMYIPMVESANSGPAHVLIGVDEKKAKTHLHRQTDASFVVRGMVEKDLGGDVRAAFEKNNIPLAADCWVVHAGRNPDSDRMAALVLIGIGAGCGALIGAWLAYKSKKSAAKQTVTVSA